MKKEESKREYYNERFAYEAMIEREEERRASSYRDYDDYRY